MPRKGEPPYWMRDNNVEDIAEHRRLVKLLEDLYRESKLPKP